MRKGVAWLFRYQHVSLKSNLRYLNALAEVSDPSLAVHRRVVMRSSRQTPSVVSSRASMRTNS